MANLQVQKWIEKWALIESKRRISDQKEANIEEATSKTEDALKALQQIDNLLIHTLSIDDTVNWEVLKKNEEYAEKKPEKPINCKEYSSQPEKDYPPYPQKETPRFNLFEKLFKSKKERKLKEVENKYLLADDCHDIVDRFYCQNIVDSHREIIAAGR